MNKLVLIWLVITMFTGNCVDMRSTPLGPSPEPNTPSSSMEYVSYVQPISNRQEEIRNTIRFKLHQWTFRPISLALQATAGGLLIGTHCCINKYPEMAKVLTGVSLGIGASSLAINTLLLHVDSKLEDLNNRIMRRQQNDIYPTIIQR